MEIVDDQHDGFEVLDELRRDCVDELVAVELGSGRRLRLRIDRAGQAADLIQDGGPEALRILFVAGY